MHRIMPAHYNLEGQKGGDQNLSADTNSIGRGNNEMSTSF
jgi:hypothetical protein